MNTLALPADVSQQLDVGGVVAVLAVPAVWVGCWALAWWRQRRCR